MSRSSVLQTPLRDIVVAWVCVDAKGLVRNEASSQRHHTFTTFFFLSLGSARQKGSGAYGEGL